MQRSEDWTQGTKKLIKFCFSCSPEGLAENPGLEPTQISAVSIARRLQAYILGSQVSEAGFLLTYV
jgi:hypothetical protein